VVLFPEFPVPRSPSLGVRNSLPRTARAMLNFALVIGVIGPKNAALSGTPRPGAPSHDLLRLLRVGCLEFTSSYVAHSLIRRCLTSERLLLLNSDSLYVTQSKRFVSIYSTRTAHKRPPFQTPVGIRGLLCRSPAGGC
jgi:hypothetical protein